MGHLLKGKVGLELERKRLICIEAKVDLAMASGFEEHASMDRTSPLEAIVGFIKNWYLLTYGCIPV